MAHSTKKILATIGEVGQIAAGIILFPIVIVSAVLLPKVSSRIFRLYGDNFFIATLRGEFRIIFSALPMKGWKKWWMMEDGRLEDYPFTWQVKYYFTCERAKKTAKLLSSKAVKMILKSDKLDARDVDNILVRTDAGDIISSLPDLRQAKIYEIYGGYNLIDFMSDEAKHIALGLTADYKAFLRKGLKLEDGEWEYLLSRKSLFDIVMLEQTPPDRIKKEVIKKASFGLEASYIVRKYGVSPSIIQALDEEELKAIEEPLREYQQRTFLSGNPALQEVEKFFVREKDICVEAQKVMNVEQYKMFHKAIKELSDEAIEYFLAKEDVEMCKCIFTFEKREFTPKAKALIAASKTLTALYNRCS